MAWVTVASYSFPYEAQIASALLRSEGIEHRIDNEHMVNTNWLYSNALGGVKVLVLKHDFDNAKALLQQDFSHELELEFDAQQEKIESELASVQTAEHDCCPRCGSTQWEPYTRGKDIAFIQIFFFGFPLFKYQHGRRCRKCQTFVPDL